MHLSERGSAVGVLVLLVLLAHAPSVGAQSTIFNIPTTDVVSKGKAYLELDYLPQVPKPDAADRLQLVNPRVVIGTGGNVELGANFLTTHVPGTTNVYFQPNIKWRFANVDAQGVAAAVGGILFTPINNRDDVDTYGLVYANVSKKVKRGSNGPRFTAGPYGVVSGGSNWVGPYAGALVGYEQPVHPKVSFVADWFSGKNGLGYFTPGVSFTLPANGLLNIGYSLGNDSYDGNDNRFLFLYYGITM